jgi:hypothetical protein
MRNKPWEREWLQADLSMNYNSKKAVIEEMLRRKEVEDQIIRREEEYASTMNKIVEDVGKLKIDDDGKNIFKLGFTKIPINDWVYVRERDSLFFTTPLRYPNGNKVNIFIKGYKINPDAEVDRFGKEVIKFDERGNRIVRDPKTINMISDFENAKEHSDYGVVLWYMSPFVILNKSMVGKDGRLRDGWQKEDGYPFTLRIKKERNFPHYAREY